MLEKDKMGRNFFLPTAIQSPKRGEEVYLINEQN